MTEINHQMQAVFNRARCLVPAAVVEAKVTLLAQRITQDLSEKNPILMCVMIGGLVPAGMLMSRLAFPLELDYVHATRYGQNLVGGALDWRVPPRLPLQGRTVLIVDDVLDGGLTLAGIVAHCQKAGAKEVLTMVLVDKRAARMPGGLIEADYVGLEVGPEFIFGMGLDYRGYFRNAPGIYCVAPEDQ
ncbi:MAG: hypoxanthine-guanine phosphoribosyltransferase [Pseudomonadota bacterium]